MKNLTIDEFKELITQNTWTHEMSIDSDENFEGIVEGGASIISKFDNLQIVYNLGYEYQVGQPDTLQIKDLLDWPDQPIDVLEFEGFSVDMEMPDLLDLLDELDDGFTTFDKNVFKNEELFNQSSLSDLKIEDINVYIDDGFFNVIFEDEDRRSIRSIQCCLKQDFDAEELTFLEKIDYLNSGFDDGMSYDCNRWAIKLYGRDAVLDFLVEQAEKNGVEIINDLREQSNAIEMEDDFER